MNIVNANMFVDTKYDIKVLGIMMRIIRLYFLKRYVLSHNQLRNTDSICNLW